MEHSAFSTGKCQSKNTIKLASHIFHSQFHPFQNLVAVSCVDGNLFLIKIEEGDDDLVPEIVSRIPNKNKASCRTSKFLSSSELVAVYNDGAVRIHSIDSNKLIRKLEFHESGVNAVAVVDEKCIASGDDEGSVAIWDLRAPQTPVAHFKEYEDYISDMCVSPAKSRLFACSGDAVGMYDLPKRSVIKLSASTGHDLSCLETFANDTTVVCGSQDGNLCIFNQENIGAVAEKMQGHKGAVECLVKIDEYTMITGCNDGLIRVVSLTPNRICGILGTHNTSETSIETVSINASNTIAGSSSHDEKMAFYNYSEFEAILENTEDDRCDLRDKTAIFDDL